MVTPKMQAMALCRAHMSMAAPVHMSWAGFGVRGPWAAIAPRT